MMDAQVKELDPSINRDDARIPLADVSPDWSKVPFPVSCARCGHDLHGQSEPTCPACGLTFKWSEAVPIEELTCATCGYHLYGLTETRCPECGNPFSWDEALARHHRKYVNLFEYQAGRCPIRSFVSTWFRTLRPKRFWNSIRLTDPPRVKPLLLTFVIALAIFWVCHAVASGFLQWLQTYLWTMGYSRSMRIAWSSTRWLQELLATVFGRFNDRDVKSWSTGLAAWMLFTFGSLLIFQQSMSRHKVKNIQLTRVWVYACSPLPALTIFGFFLAAVALTWFDVRLLRHYQPIPWAVLIVLVPTTRSIHIAYRDYLRIPHSIAVAVSSQVIAVLAAGILEMAIAGDPHRSLFFRLLFAWDLPGYL